MSFASAMVSFASIMFIVDVTFVWLFAMISAVVLLVSSKFVPLFGTTVVSFSANSVVKSVVISVVELSGASVVMSWKAPHMVNLLLVPLPQVAVQLVQGDLMMLVQVRLLVLVMLVAMLFMMNL